MTPLRGTRIVELAGLAPAPYAGMILADFGAEVIRVDRAPAGGGAFDATRDFLARGKRSVGINLKDPRGVDLLIRLLETAHVLIEPFRPGVMEKLGLGPDLVLERNPKLVYARLTGWGQSGPYAPMAGHDINYIALSGALSLLGREGQRPLPPINLLGDFAGGGMLCTLGIMMALFESTRSGKGQVVDAAMVDGAANISTFIFGMKGAGLWPGERGTNLLDGGAHFYDTYETADGKYLAVGAIESQFYAALLGGLGLADEDLPHQMDREAWPLLRNRFGEIFKTRTRDQWCEIFDGTDACVAPILEFEEAASHPHNRARATFVDGVAGQPTPTAAPRLSRTPGAASANAPRPGEDSVDIFSKLGLANDEVDELVKAGVIG